MHYKKIEWRESDQKIFMANNNKIAKKIDWTPEVNSKIGIEKLINGK